VEDFIVGVAREVLVAGVDVSAPMLPGRDEVLVCVESSEDR